MSGFLIVITIILPSSTNFFTLTSHALFEHSACVKRAGETAERAMAHVRRRMPSAIITTETSCDLRPTRAV